jgi:hypothetical protein
MLLVVAATTAGYALGRRANRGAALRIARELEEALEPDDTLYTWIGGLIGFHAEYEVRDLRRVRITCTLLPRHSVMYLPVAVLLGRGDRLHVTLTVAAPPAVEVHLVSARALRSPLLHIRGRDRMQETRVFCDGRWFVLLGTGAGGLERMRRLLGQVRDARFARHLRHVAVVPDAGSVYVQVRPVPGAARSAAGCAAELARELSREHGCVRGAGDQESVVEMGGMQKVPVAPGTASQV